MQHGKSATWNECKWNEYNMKKMQHGISAIQRKFNIKKDVVRRKHGKWKK